MISRKVLYRLTAIAFLAGVTGLFGLVGCSTDNPVEPLAINATADEDVAELIASDLGYDDGGAADQVGDLLLLASGGEIQSTAKLLAPDAVVGAPIYNADSGKWTFSFTRERLVAGTAYQARFSRTYCYQFLNQFGEPQQSYISGSDTAYSIKFEIVEGSGHHVTARLSQTLTALSGSWTATGTNGPIVTINGTYARSGVDTVRTRRATRTMTHTCNWQFVDITGPRGVQTDLCEAVSGAVNGSVNANVTFISGNGYAERNITRTMTATMNHGEAQIDLNGNHYRTNLCAGELVTDETM